MKLLVDMNLSPDWTTVLAQAGWETVHWSAVGNPRADDSEIMSWAKENGSVVFTHDLDFGTTLADAMGRAERYLSPHARRDAFGHWKTGGQCSAPISIGA
jgi:predicted nuclease of predicted toxin-antitoxin system